MRRQQTLYIHIGRGKTGTTCIQNYLSCHRQELEKLGVQYVYADDLGRGCGHQQLAKSFVDHPPDGMIPSLKPDQVRRAVLDEISASKSRVFLLSSENFAIANVAKAASYFSYLRGKCSVKVILFVRSQDELAESEYNQLVKMGMESESFSSYVHRRLDGCDFMKVAQPWERHFGYQNLICRVYDGAKRDIVERFFACIPEIEQGSMPKATTRRDRLTSNSSIGIAALVAARILNYAEVENGASIAKSIFSRLAKNDLPALFFNSQQASKFRCRFAASNRQFSRRYLGRARADLGGRRYSDEERDRIRQSIRSLAFAHYSWGEEATTTD